MFWKYHIIVIKLLSCTIFVNEIDSILKEPTAKKPSRQGPAIVITRSVSKFFDKHQKQAALTFHDEINVFGFSAGYLQSNSQSPLTTLISLQGGLAYRSLCGI